MTVAGSHYTYVKNTKYWNPGSQHYERVVVKVVPDPNSAIQALKAGQVNILLSAPLTYVDQARASGFEVGSGLPNVVAVYLMDRSGEISPALARLEVRQALNYATDRAGIAKALGINIYTPTDQIVAKGATGYDPTLENSYTYDPSKAKDLLTKAGYPDGLNLTILFWSNDVYPTVAQTIAEQWKQVGVNVTLKDDGSNVSQFVKDYSSGEYPALVFQLSGDAFPSALQNFALQSSAFNPFHTAAPGIGRAFDALATAQQNQLDPLSKALNRAVSEQAWFVPVVSHDLYIFGNGIKNLGGWSTTGAFDVLDWQPQ